MTCGKMTTIANPKDNGTSTIPCLLEKDHPGDCDPRFHAAPVETLDPKPDSAPEPHTIVGDGETFSLDDFTARVVKMHPRRGDFIFVSLPQLTDTEIAPIARHLGNIFNDAGAKYIVTNKRVDALDEQSMNDLGWFRSRGVAPQGHEG